MRIADAIFRPPQPVPSEYKKPFTHLYLDILWFGILSGSIGSFLTVYLARVGANVQQLGLLSAVPAIINLLVALPAGQWIDRHAHGRPVFWASLIHRLFYLLLIPITWIAEPSLQIWAVIIITFIMNIPGTALAVGFNALFGDVVPTEWRAYITGIRNALLSITSILSGLVCGQILVRVAFPINYQIVFGLGALGAIMSSLQLSYLRGKKTDRHPILIDEHSAVVIRAQSTGLKRRLGFKAWLAALVGGNQMLRLEILRTPFGKVLALLFIFHLGQFLAIPLFSVYMVDQVHFSDQVISFGSAMFNFTVFLLSTQVVRVVPKLGNKRATGIGVVLLSTYPAMMALSRNPEMFMLTSFIGGFAWGLTSGAYINYLLDRAPQDDRPCHMAWYNLALNAAILIGSLAGPAIAAVIGMRVAMWVFAGVRLIAGIAILKWG